MEIEGKKAVVVGGASGFGRATAESLAKRGASVAVLDRPQSKGREVADAIGGTFHEVDVTDFAGTEQVLQQAIDALGGLHIAVTTAGGGTAERTVSKTGPHSLDSFRASVDLNLIGTFNISRLAAWQMSKNEPEDEERGVIINTASLGIRVLAIAPSLFATGLTEGIPDEFAKQLTKDAAFPKRLGRPEEYAKLALAIVDNPMLNGQCLRLDAGQRFAPK